MKDMLLRPHPAWDVVDLANTAGRRLCQGLTRAFVRDMVEAYRTTSTPTCYVILEVIPELTLRDTCGAGLVKAMCLMESSPDEWTIDLFCAQKGSGRPLMDKVFDLVKKKGRVRRITLNSTLDAWKFYWKCGYRLDLREEDSPVSRIPVTSLFNMDLVDAYLQTWLRAHRKVRDVQIPMVLTL